MVSLNPSLQFGTRIPLNEEMSLCVYYVKHNITILLYYYQCKCKEIYEFWMRNSSNNYENFSKASYYSKIDIVIIMTEDTLKVIFQNEFLRKWNNMNTC